MLSSRPKTAGRFIRRGLDPISPLGITQFGITDAERVGHSRFLPNRRTLNRCVAFKLVREMLNGFMDDPTFTIEDDQIGLGFCVVVRWAEGRREVVTGSGSATEASRWVAEESRRWLANIPRNVQGTQWVNNRLPKN